LSFTPETLQRQWQTLRLIPRHPRRISATDIHAQLSSDGYKVAKRTVERDLHTLSSIFPLVVDERAKPYGWSWLQDAPAFDLPGLSNSEALTLLLAREHLVALLPASTLAQMRPHFRMAEGKLAAFGKHSGAADWMDKVRVIPATQPLLAPRIDADIQATINDALLLGKQVKVSYRKRAADVDETYPIHPLGLVQRGQVLYLVCTIKSYSHLRLLALHRIQAAATLEQALTKPVEFNLDAYLESGAFGWLPGPAIRLEAAFTVEAATHLEETPLSNDQTMTPLPDGRVKVAATVRETLQLHWWLQGFGDAVEVVSPPSLRQRQTEAARRLADRYNQEEE
jgi:predicted DNA-binding transcriptional regulator YafY